MKKVSVIIPTYKRSEFLTRAIDSVLNQTYSNIEVIVVDDNNIDSEFRKINEQTLAKYISENRIIYLKHEKNKNGAAARNTGIKKATGDYITFLDDDDFFLKDRITLLVKTLDENPDYDGAYTSMIKIKNGFFSNYRRGNKNGNFLVDTLCHNSIIGTGSNMFFRRKAIEHIGEFDEKFIRFQDLEYMARFFMNYKIIGIDKVLVVKCEEDKLNYPSYEKLKNAIELFINKFDEEISKHSSSKNIKYCCYKELYIFSQGEDHTDAKKEITAYGKIKMKDKVLYVYNWLYIHNPLFKRLDKFIRIRRCNGNFTLTEKEEINLFLKK